MTIRLPHPTKADRLLRVLGKKRGVVLPQEFSTIAGDSDVYLKARKESFVRALIRPKSRDLPEGLIDIFDLTEMFGDEGKISSDLK